MPPGDPNRGIPRVSLALWSVQLLLPGAVLAHRLGQWPVAGASAALLRWDVLAAVAWIAAVLILPGTSAGRGWVQRSGPKVGLLCLSLAGSLVVAEGLLRLRFYGTLTPGGGGPMQELRQPHPTRGWTLVPDGRGRRHTRDYSVTVQTNGNGLRDVEHDYAPAPDTFRVVVLGDSFMEAYQVELAQALPRRLERKLSGRGVEVINLGVGGYGTAQEYVYLLEEGLRYEPDLVLLSFFSFNDVRNNHAGLEGHLRQSGVPTMRTFGRPYGRVDPLTRELTIEYPDAARIDAWVAERRRTKVRYIEDVLVSARLLDDLFSQVRSSGERAVPTHDPNVWLGSIVGRYDGESGGRGVPTAEYTRMWSEAWDVSLSLIDGTRDLAAENGAEFAVFLVPHVAEVDDREFAELTSKFAWMEFDRDLAAARVLDFARAEGVHALDLAPAFRNRINAGEGPYYHAIDDNHWNAAGHLLATETLIQFLEERGLVPPAR